MAIEIVDFPIKHGGSFHGKMWVHQRVNVSNSAGFPVWLDPKPKWVEISHGEVVSACVEWEKMAAEVWKSWQKTAWWLVVSTPPKNISQLETIGNLSPGNMMWISSKYDLNIIWLGVEPYPSEKYEWKSVGMMKFPVYGKMKNDPNHQPE